MDTIHGRRVWMRAASVARFPGSVFVLRPRASIPASVALIDAAWVFASDPVVDASSQAAFLTFVRAVFGLDGERPMCMGLEGLIVSHKHQQSLCIPGGRCVHRVQSYSQIVSKWASGLREERESVTRIQTAHVGWASIHNSCRRVQQVLVCASVTHVSFSPVSSGLSLSVRHPLVCVFRCTPAFSCLACESFDSAPCPDSGHAGGSVLGDS